MHELNYLRRGVSFFVSILLTGLPLLSDPVSLVGVARATGPIEINGRRSPPEATLYSGDRVDTGQSILTVAASPEEKLQVEAQSRVSFRKDGDVQVVNLEKGTVTFRSAGLTRAAVEVYGIEVRVEKAAIAQVALLSPTKAQVAALQGSVEVKAPGRSVTLKPGEAALLTASAPQDPQGAGSNAGLSSGAKLALTLAVIGGVAAAIAIPVALAGGPPPVVVSPSVP